MNVFFFKDWDAKLYAGIAEHGYQFSATKPSNTAFFPLFPYIWKTLWKLTGAGVEGICLYNILMLFGGMLVLKNTFKFSWSYFLLFVSIPSNIFMYVPYSEGTFFFFSTLVLAGIKTNKKYLIFFGLFFAGLTRPSAAFFIPAIISMELVAFDNFKSFTKNVLTYSLFPLAAMLVTFLFQWKATGVWLAFFKDGWRRVMQLPEFPLTTWGGLKNLWLDGLALFFGILALICLVALMIAKLKKSKNNTGERSEAFSLTYVLMALITILIFGGNDQGGGTTLLSLNRFLMATPYFTVMLYFLSHRVNLDFKAYTIYIICALFTLSLVNLNGTGYTEYGRQDKFFYALLMLGSMLIFLTISKKYNGRYIPMLYIINVFTQVILLHQFSHGIWIG